MDVFSIVLGSSFVDVNVHEFFHVGKYGGKFLFFNFLVVLEEMPRVRFSSGPNSVSAIRGEDGSSASTMGDERMLEKDGDIVEFLYGCSEFGWVSFNILFPITHTTETMKLYLDQL
jgi:hypothetical protein